MVGCLLKILGLLNSNVHGGAGRIAESSLFPKQMERPLGEALGEHVEIIAREVWPTADLPGIVTGWMRTYEPDLVVLPITSFWFLYESVPLRFERFGVAGKMVSRVGRNVAGRPWLAHNRPFQALRRRSQKFVQGKPHFQPEEVIRIAQATARAVVQREGVYLVIVAPSGGEQWAADEAATGRAERRRVRVDQAMSAFCASIHAEYWDLATMAALRDPRKPALQGDQLHLNEEGHRRTAQRYMDFSIALCRRAVTARQNGEPGGPV